MKKLLILFGIILSVGLNAQIPGEPNASGVIEAGPPYWVTGVTQGDGELKLQFTYLNERGDSTKLIFNYEDSTINALQYIDWSLIDGWEYMEGREGWNDVDKTLEFGLDRGSVLQIGQEFVMRATNKSGSDILDGAVVRIDSAQGNRPTITLVSDTSAAAILTLGVATQDIDDDDIGYVTLLGLVRGYDTRPFDPGDPLWLGTTPGSLTNVRPDAPNTAISLGVSLNSTEDGIIAVRPVVVQRLSWLSDVGARDNQADNDLLTWDADSAEWKARDSIVIRVLDYEPPHGAYSFADSTSTPDLTQNVWAKITNGDNDLYTAIDEDGITMVGDTITIITPGDYMLWANLSFNGNSQDVYHCAFYKNNVITAFEMHRKTANNDTGNMALSALFDDLAIGDDISIFIRNTANNNDPTFISSQITVLMIHPR